MKPIKIEFQAFGPYTGHEVVDFEAISSKGLFLICGKTGIGKTMILDAMTFALYGKSSGNVRDDFEAMRSTNADFSTDTFVKFVFENNGDYFLFERRLERKRTKLSASYSMQKKGDDGVWRPIDTENPKASDLNAKAVELIGLEYGQFSQVIVLPQGKFEKLLTSNSEDKEKILTSIFGEEKWKEFADKFFEEVQNRKSELDAKKLKIDISLSNEGCENPADLNLKITNKQKELDELTEEFKKEDLDKKKEKLQAQLMLVNSFKDLHKQEAELENLMEQKQDRADWEETLVWGKKAENTRKFIDAYDSSYTELEDRKADEEKALKDKENKAKIFENSEKKYNDLVGKKEEIENKKKTITQYEGKIPDYEGLEKVSEDVATRKKALKNSEKQMNDAKEAYEEFAPKIADLKSGYDALLHEHTMLLNTYLAGITGELASKLEEGKPCPVCGSTSHPHKAAVSENSVSKEEVDSKKKEADSAYKKMNEAIKKQDEAKSAFEKIKGEYDQAQKEIIQKETNLENMRKNMVEDIPSIAALNDAILKLKREVKAFEEALSNAETEKNNASKALTASESNCKACAGETKKAENKFKKAEEDLVKSLEENEFENSDSAREFLLTPEEIENYTTGISEYDAAVSSAKKQISELQKTVKDSQEPDEAECKNAIKELDNKKVKFETEKSNAEEEIKRLKAKEEAIAKESEGLPEQLRQANDDLTFAKRLRGDSGTGLQRYVLGIMFSQVIASANKMLEMVHGGRYRLFRSDDKVAG
ncbi:MAG: SMC family ATPase, partial [Lachnospiraceae bacterium]|nr:SMC family ATPase [Lachnospiraceae bacterium]